MSKNRKIWTGLQRWNSSVFWFSDWGIRDPKMGNFTLPNLFARYYWVWIYTGFRPLSNTTPLLVQVGRKRGELATETEEDQKPKPGGRRIRISNKWAVNRSWECTPKSVQTDLWNGNTQLGYIGEERWQEQRKALLNGSPELLQVRRY